MKKLPGLYGPRAPATCPPKYATAPDGRSTGELVKIEARNEKNDKATLAVVAAALSTATKAPYSTILAAISAAVGFTATDVYYVAANYRVWSYGTSVT
ncbi:hypothetical protein WJ0W_002201 [Paenibacillus melissococcoides]|uniref:Uncharacterized protein n=1 Tax=Paenibacillus melissococcoides TaxID=2912268 RepID=A0ABN8U1M2_9BACL|nr:MULTISPECIES: hypothetical protein [Paenibacillus]MEB9895315.1 hypothetical protein [Bacillus cereus]CAH8244971.1 hypothetical protein WJ0W_002201 [Paenibacillus melissococcoides]CAH8709522.1 hypothetical protein WDD9_002283 [Paenibacillus melissococcoides]CAH8710249.1 hypothetical protein HTL2_002570 [Paenibacillus melissococcoides]GIO78345.1 hypothetical protein J6TS7_19550 [Paenibacillus dendritiformis]